MFALLPDLDDVLHAFLATHASLTPLHAGRVSTTLLPGSTSAVRISAIGGFQDKPWEGASEYQVECWGGTQTQANTLARTVIAAVWDLHGPVTGGHVNSTVVTLRPLDSPDPSTGRARTILQIQITAHPEVAP